MKTQKIEIAIAVNSKGMVTANGWVLAGKHDPDKEGMMDIAIEMLGEPDPIELHYWVTAEIPIPQTTLEAPVIQGEVMIND